MIGTIRGKEEYMHRRGSIWIICRYYGKGPSEGENQE